jgi:hypothetical protein
VYHDGSEVREKFYARSYTSCWRWAIRNWLQLENVRSIVVHQIEPRDGTALPPFASVGKWTAPTPPKERLRATHLYDTQTGKTEVIDPRRGNR